jgi:hypothetical protein
MQSEEDNNNAIWQIVTCCIQCLLQIIGDLLEYFNRYAFAQVAIYGKDYCSAAKDTWNLCKARGIDAIINDNLIGNVLGVGSLIVGLLTAFVGWVFYGFLF